MTTRTLDHPKRRDPRSITAPGADAAPEAQRIAREHATVGPAWGVTNPYVVGAAR
jgi:hypothetical protein